MRKWLTLSLIFLTSCASTSTQGMKNDNIYKEFEKTTKAFPKVEQSTLTKAKQEKKKISSYLNNTPVKYALKAFCYDQKLSCDLSALSKSENRITLSSFKGTPEEFLSLVERRTGVKHKKIGDTLVFFKPKLISVKAVNLPLGEFLKIISEKLGGYSIIFGKGVDLKAPITVLAENQPIEEVLEQAFGSLGYAVEIDTSRKILKIDGWVSKTIQLPSFFSNSKTANLSSTASVYGTNGGGSNTSSTMTMTFMQRMKSDFENTIRNILGGNRRTLGQGLGQGFQQGKFSINYDLGELYVEGRAEDVRKVEEYVENLRKKLSKQVLVDIAVIEQRIDDSRTYGIDWAVMFEGLRNKNITVTQSSLGSTIGVLNIEIAGSKFASVIKAIQQTGKARIITNFRLSVPNYDISTLSSAVTRQFITQIQREVNPQTGRETYSTTTQQVSEGSALFVRPIVRDDGKIDIVIAPTISSILGVDSQQFGDITLQNPIVAQRNSPLRLIVKPNKTYIVGGIITSNTGTNKSGIPYLTDIPVIGNAFGKTEETKRNSVIYVVLRTHVLEE